ncbi:sulfite exporter TauE/SafE family protein [Candidatus Bathyarchaeota archaeon]|nr:MAG: sulfite exporter TauE/SafE family protein [Candidatus Bathyarchaeota archaeon]
MMYGELYKLAGWENSDGVEMFLTMLYLLFIAFFCGLVDSSMGMCYGTILSPTLLLMGYSPIVVVPSILFSQALSGVLAAGIHHYLGNVDFRLKSIDGRPNELGYIEAFRRLSMDLKVTLCITLLGMMATIIAALTAIALPRMILKTYIGILVIIMGVLLLLDKHLKFSLNKMIIVGVLSAFNKGLSGGGFGPIVTSGQIISGREYRRSIATTILSKALICIVGFLTYLLRFSYLKWSLIFPLSIGAILGSIIGPHITRRIKFRGKGRLILSFLIMALGSWTLLRTWMT